MLRLIVTRESLGLSLVETRCLSQDLSGHAGAGADPASRPQASHPRDLQAIQRIVYRQETDQLGPTAAALGLTGTEQRLLPGLGTGQGLWRIKDRSFVVQHQLHPAELAAFDTTARMTGIPRKFKNPEA